MSLSVEEALLLFLALIGLYSPVAGVASYMPILGPFTPRERLRLAVGLFFNVAAISVVTVWAGEPLLHLLGLSTAALSATGGISLMIAAVPLMLGRGEASPKPEPAAVVPRESGVQALVPAGAATRAGDGSARAHELADGGIAVDTLDPAGPHSAEPAVSADLPAQVPERPSWRSIVFMPITFPLTIGGATIAIIVGFRAESPNTLAVVGLTIAVLGYATVTGVSLYIAGHLERRVSDKARGLIDRVAGILLVAIAATLLASGFTRLVIDVLHNVKIL